MTEANSDKQSRIYWENKIDESYGSIPFDKPGWFLSKEFHDFVDVLTGLKRYYTASGDVVIGLEPVGILNSVIKLLVREICDQNLTTEKRDEAIWALAYLQASIGTVVTEAVMNLNDQNDSNN